jgi:hypothetical protein
MVVAPLPLPSPDRKPACGWHNLWLFTLPPPGVHAARPGRRKQEDEKKRKEQAKILGKGRQKLSFSLGFS